MYLKVQNIWSYGCARVTVLDRRVIIIIVFVESNTKLSVVFYALENSLCTIIQTRSI